MFVNTTAMLATFVHSISLWSSCHPGWNVACWLLLCLFLACPAATHCCSDAKIFQPLPILCSKHKITSLAQPVQLGLGVFKDRHGSLHLSAKHLLSTPCRTFSSKNKCISNVPATLDNGIRNNPVFKQSRNHSKFAKIQS